MQVGQVQAGARDAEVVFKVPLGELAERAPRKLTLYRTAPDEAGAAQQKSLKAAFGKAAHFETDKVSGGVFSADKDRLWAQPPKSVGEIQSPDEERSRKTAERFLREIKGLPEGQKTIQRVSVDTMERKDKEGVRQSRTVGVNVTYRRLLQGREVVGPGGKLKVFLDAKGEPAGYLRVWRRLKPEQAERLISFQEALERFKKDPLGRVLLSGVEKVEVTDIRPAYLEHGVGVAQKYVQPIYLFNCTAHVKVGDQQLVQVPYARYMAALVKPPEPLWPRGREYKAGERPKVTATPGED